MGKRGCLRCPDNPARESGDPVFQKRHVVAMGMNHDDSPLPVQFHKPVGSAVEVSEDGVRAYAMGIEYFRSSIRGKNNAIDLPCLVL